jgi:hypothetical protein
MGGGHRWQLRIPGRGARRCGLRLRETKSGAEVVIAHVVSVLDCAVHSDGISALSSDPHARRAEEDGRATSRRIDQLSGALLLKPNFATDIVANKAKNATKIADGIVVTFPSLLLATKSGPNTAVNDTETQITPIASDAHRSRASNHTDLLASDEGS